MTTASLLLATTAALVDGDRLLSILRMSAIFFVVIGILIVIHEFGHFAVARLSGVGVERFSIGFGPVLWSYKGPMTEYCISAIPLGGYVKMMGDDENPLEGGGGAPVDPAKAFHLKPLWIRFLIVFAGPGMNFVLAAVIVALVLMMAGRPMSAPVISRVTEGSPAAQAGLQAGDRVVAVDGRPTAYWEDVAQLIQASDGKRLRLTVRRVAGESQVDVTPVPTVGRDPLGDEHRYWHIGAFTTESPPPVIGQVVPDTPAGRAGIKTGDIVLTVEGKSVRSWDEMADVIRKRPGQPTTVTVKRGDETLTLSVTPQADKDVGPDGKPIEVGRIGITQSLMAPRDAIFVRLGPLEAAREGVLKTVEWTVVTVRGLYKIVVGQLSRSNIGGPIQIAQAAGEQARQGLSPLALFTAVVSVNLAVLNLLPVPMLDGGHLLFFVIEGILGRPLSERKRELAQQVGGALLLLLIGFALYNDLARLDVFGFFR